MPEVRNENTGMSLQLSEREHFCSCRVKSAHQNRASRPGFLHR